MKQKQINFVAFFVLLTHAATVAAQSEPAAQVRCAIPVSTAETNLLARGYEVVDKGAGQFRTEFKTSIRDSERKMLGGFSVERERRYRVVAEGENSIRFTARHRETEYRSEGPGGKRDIKREFDLPQSAALRDTLDDMRKEVCTAVPPTPVPAAAIPDDIASYLKDRCKTGDERACRLVPAAQ